MLPHISENTRQPGAKTYYRTDNPDIFIEMENVSREISISRIQTELDNIRDRIASLQEAIVNFTMITPETMGREVDELQSQVNAQQAFINMLTGE
jgi:predicted  nucleic acid-binding Zn-ribbon protein